MLIQTIESEEAAFDYLAKTVTTQINPAISTRKMDRGCQKQDSTNGKQPDKGNALCLLILLSYLIYPLSRNRINLRSQGDPGEKLLKM